MANYSTLKAAVADVVKTNGTQAITGANLQAVLLSIINSVGGGGYIFKGVATPSTSAGTPDENVFYLGGAGTYANFGASVTVPVGSICVFKYNGSWTNEQIETSYGGVFDISEYHATGGTLATYADLAAALGNGGANVPSEIRKGGMCISFVQSSDNKYVQYRHTGKTFTTNVADWVSVEKITEPLFNALGYEQIIYAANDFEVTGTRYLLVVLQNYPTLVGIGNTVEVVFQADVDCVIIPYAYGNAGSIYHTYPQITLIANVPSTVIMSIDESQTYYAFGGLATTAGNYSIKVTNYDFEKIKELNKIEADLIYDWILSESYNVVSASYTDGEINSPVSVKWPDGETGTLTLTKNADGLIIRVDASYKSSTYRLTITRNSEGNTTATSIVKL